MKVRKLPLRMCLACREMKDKRELVRMVKTPDCRIQIDDAKGKSAGRGAYICLSSTCLDRVIKIKAFERAFGQNIGSDVYDLLKTEVLKRNIMEQRMDIRGEING